ncbi:MAG: hypothetical protein GWO41_13470 [candidate division Zixibacteria bacterium]|nr:hypothetical protein [candidate division Zixibacteria bacterium]NIR63075.1 hypothetical protein [candidate division Zixibacteria bacterium]NIS17368.1 hypothetical protein [candidate division Zixibacteria bacterium]NIS45335.1 hypothetical protein [candidate division Zixibacteria bacterium]NIT53707.1 hypothetical protein [candidate division Zixibacteria bacterium]
MGSLIGRFLTLAGAAVVVISLFIPVIQLEFEVPEQRLGQIVLKPRPVKVESSLYELDDKLSGLEESGAELPKVLDFLWLIFLGLAVINGLLAIKRSFPRILRALVGILPLAFLIIVIWQTVANPNIVIGYGELLNYFVRGFYVLLGGTLIILLGSIMTGSKRIRNSRLS